MMSTIDRRTFLRTGLLLAASGLAARRSAAQSMGPRPPALLVVFCGGGWDVHLLGEPRGMMADQQARARLVRYAPSEVQHIGNLDVGPVLAPFAKSFGDRLTIVRGVHMGIDGHEFATHHMLYGEQLFQLYPSDRDTLQAAWVRSHGDTMLPNVSLSHVAMNTARLSDPGLASPIFVTPDALEALFGPGEQLMLKPEARDMIETQVLSRTTGVRRASFQRAATMARRDLSGVLSIAPAVSLLGDRTADVLSDFDRQCLMAYQLIANGMSSCVTIGQTGFDTHLSFEYDDHIARGRAVFGDPGRFNGRTGLSMLLDLLARPTDPQGGSPLDRTTIVIASEFSRAELQRNHNPENNHYLLLGKGFARTMGGRVFGASDENTATALKVDPKTGQPDPNGVLLTPGVLFDTVLSAGGAAASRGLAALLA